MSAWMPRQPAPYGGGPAQPPPPPPYGAPQPYGVAPQAPYSFGAPPPSPYSALPQAPAAGQIPLPLSEQVPPEVYQQAVIFQLGEPTAIYKPSITNPLTIIGIVLGVSILDILLLIATFNAHIIFSLLIALPIVMVIWGVRAFMWRNVRIYLFTNGFIRANGMTIDAVRWDQVEAVFQRAVRNRYGNVIRYSYTVRRGDGAVYKFNSLIKKVADLGNTIQHEVTKVHIPRAIAAFNSGNPLYFGKLSLNVQGISKGSAMLPWIQVRNVDLNRGYVRIWQNGRSMRWARVRVADVPNLLVFLEMVDYARSRQGLR